MSRIGQKPVAIPQGVEVSVAGGKVTVKGKLGELAMTVPSGIAVETADGHVRLARTEDTRAARGCHGMARTMIANMVEGVTKGFVKDLEIQGVGFKAALQGKKLSLSLGFASPVEFTVPDGVKVAVEGGTALTVQGIDKQLVGDTAARIRGFYPAEPYKGKGIRYKGEYVRKKVGKTVA